MNSLAVHVRRTGAPGGATLDGPATASPGDLVLAWDGRIDNREEFGSRAGVQGLELAGLSDEALLLAAYRLLGVEALAHLVGDYAFALWDHRQRTLLCARDPLAQRPFFYHVSASTFVAASSLAGMLAHPEVPRAPNEGVVAEYLLGAMASREETLFAGVRRLLPGTWMRVDRETVRHGTIAWLNPSAEIRYRHEGEYAEHLRDLLHVAVRARLRDAGRVGIELSGGVDSSTVAAIARAELGVHAADRILLLSLVFPGLTCDERPFIEACHEAWRLPAYVVAAAGHEAADTGDESRHLDFPYHPNGAMCSGMRRYARAAGIRVILTGIGGDEWFSGSRYHLADDFRRGRIWNAIRQAQVDREFEPGPGALASLVTYGARPCAPAPIKALARRFRGAPSIHAPWIENAFAARANLAERLRVRPDAPAFPTLAQAEIFRGAIGGWAIHSAEMEARQARHLGIELRQPLADLRVARFALAIPETQRWSRRDRKHVLRAAAAGLVPDRVRLRGSKVDFTPVVVQALEAQGGAAFFRRLHTAAMGWVNPAPLERMYGEMLSYDQAADPRCADTAWDLWMIAGIERWARAAGFVAVSRTRERATA